MVLGYWDRGDAGIEWLGMGKLIDFWREYSKYSDGTGSLNSVPNILEELRIHMGTNLEGETWTDDISSGIESTVNTGAHGYDFSSDETSCSDSFMFGNDWCWNTIRSEINNSRPFVWSVGQDDMVGHSLAAWGYRDDKYVITYNTWQCPGRDDWYYSEYDNGSGIDWGYVHTAVPGGWAAGQTSLTSPDGGEVWKISGRHSITWYDSEYPASYPKRSDLYYSTDGGVTWSLIASLDTTGKSLNSYSWTVPSAIATTTKARIRVITYVTMTIFGFTQTLHLAGDGSEENFRIVEPRITVSTPNGGELWFAGETRNITWSASNAGSYVNIELSPDGGEKGSWSTLATYASNTGLYSWNVSGPGCSTCRIRVSSTAYPAASDTSNADFAIGQITVTSPNGGETLYGGDTKTITWTSANVGSYVKIMMSSDGGASWDVITNSTSNTGSYNWTVTRWAAYTTCRIRVMSIAHPSVGDASDADFTIAMRTLTITSPNGGESWFAGETKNITWTSANAGSFVKIELSRDQGSTWSLIAENTTNTGLYSWLVSGPTSTVCRVRVTSATYPAVLDFSNAYFSIL
jgi:hypothetical protein